MNRWISLTSAAASAATMVIGAGVAAAAPSPVRETFHELKTVNVFQLEDDPACPLSPGTVTAVETAVGHLVAAGVDVGDPDDPNDDQLVGPARLNLNLTSKVTYVPDDPSLPSYSGHSGQHFAWNVDVDGLGVARVERTIMRGGSDGSRYVLHQVGRAGYDLSQVNSPNEGIVDIVFDKIRCG